MSKPLQALAPGYLSLLGLKNMGTLPGEAMDTVQPVVDMLQFFYRGQTTIRAGDIPDQNFAGPGNNSFTPALVVPEGKIWVVLGGYLALNIAPPQVASIRARLFVLNPTLGHTVLSEPAQIGDFLTAPVAGPAAASILAMIYAPRYLVAGDQVVAHVDWSRGAGLISMSCSLQIAELVA